MYCYFIIGALELWYLIVNGYAIILSIILTFIGVTYTRKQK